MAKTLEIERQGVGTDFVAHEEPAVIQIRMMTRLGDPAVVGGQQVADLGHDADAVGAGDDQPESTHGVTPQTSKGPF
ncbi:hypothetical protein D3C73_1633610 [compost metagenome]